MPELAAAGRSRERQGILVRAEQLRLEVVLNAGRNFLRDAEGGQGTKRCQVLSQSGCVLSRLEFEMSSAAELLA